MTRGDVIQIFRDPDGRRNPEGLAELIGRASLFDTTTCNAWHVHFMSDDDGSTYRRLVARYPKEKP